MPSATNRVIIAAAGSKKTQLIIDEALADPGKRTLITTYTIENLSQITRRIQERTGIVPANVTTMGWFSFLINQVARPYQVALTGEPDFIRSLDFVGKRPRVPRLLTFRFYFDSRGNLYRDEVADFACRVDDAAQGEAIARLEQLYDCIYIDELQDLVGYDLDFLDKLFASSIEVVAVGDPRQHTFATNDGSRNKQYRGAGLLKWLTKRERNGKCRVEIRAESWRCNQAICDFSDAIYPDMPATTSRNTSPTGHDGIFRIAAEDVMAYVDRYNPVVLRDSKRRDTMNLPAMNVGVSKGSTYERVLIFPTQPMQNYLKHADPSKLKAPDKLYVAVTRARHSVAFVVDQKDADYTP